MNQLVAYFLLLFSTHICLAVEPDQKKTYRLQILHNNDLHSKFDEMDENTAPCPQEYIKHKKCFGGFARMKKAADDAREKANKNGIPSIFLNAGDNFSGSPYYTVFGWKVVKDLIDQLGLDAMSLGNHEFDGKIEGLVKYLEVLETPVVCSNLDMTDEQKLLNLGKLPHSIILKRKYAGEEIKIGVIGYLSPKVKGWRMEKLKILDEIPAIRATAKYLRKKEKVKFIIALGHAGFEDDIKIAKAVKEINLVVGGDSHTFLYTPKNETDKPPSVEKPTSLYPEKVIVKKKDKDYKDSDEEKDEDEKDQSKDEDEKDQSKDEDEKDRDDEVEDEGKEVIVPVVQAYAYGKYLGILEIEFDDHGNVIEAAGNPLLLDSDVEKDIHMNEEVSKWTEDLKEKIPGYKDIIGYTRTFLKRPDYSEGRFESNLANLVTDAFIDYGIKLAKKENVSSWTRTPISFYPGGGVRININNHRSRGALTIEDLMTILPFQHPMFEVTVLGETVGKFLELNLSLYGKDGLEFKGKHYIHFSGLKVVYDLTKPENYQVVSVQALCKECEFPEYLPIKDEEHYSIITQRTEANKFERIQNNLEKTKLDIEDIDVLIAYVKENYIIAPFLDDRVTVSGFKLTSLPEIESN